ncbi:MAG: hypothetical protein HS102_02400 [Planctomycetia bacterium]|nr:hypothetical protein [Planctomycetia bacterium]MCK6466549.1 hypothetical protein [Phycisphaerae bacterium]
MDTIVSLVAKMILKHKELCHYLDASGLPNQDVMARQALAICFDDACEVAHRVETFEAKDGGTIVIIAYDCNDKILSIEFA